MAEKSFFDTVYGVDTPEGTRDLYDAWAATYDEDVTGNGYATPGRCAAALAGELHRSDRPILDFGCGTGLSGHALASLGFSVIDGVDLSAEMLVTARARGVYRSLRQIEAGGDIGVAPGDYAAIAAIGVISTGAAPADTLDTLLDLLSPGGLIVFSLNDHALADPSYPERVAAHLASGKAVQRFHDYGPHLPGQNLNSAVYVLERK